jgi:serine/threonine-protein phosphatase 2B regulatory subunit
VYDVDGDGVVGPEDLEIVLRQLGGSSLSDPQIRDMVQRVMREAGASPEGITRGEFEAALGGLPLQMSVAFPTPT